ncbi:MAG: flagellin FliC [Burkholderiales bacterium]|nr:flagellin FliC [Burkholderiales bacterium]MDE1927230.1 flagellin FliC [Burkholderiales bacterium]MDE2501564.1 flagellin FliC [Burkholderiales bacterium]
MSQVLNTNLMSLIAQRNLSASQMSLSTSMQRLSSGLRINSSADDAAGLSIATRMNSQVLGMAVAGRNANDAISLSQTADGAMGSVSNLLQTMRQLAVQSANGTNTSADRANLNQEFQQLAQEATRTLGGTQFNGQNILASTNAQTFQIGANATTNLDQIKISGYSWATDTSVTAVLGSAVITGTATAALGIAGTDGTAATAAITAIDTAITAVNTQRATYGATENRFNNVISNLQTAGVNQSAAYSRIMDADYASETANLSRSQILQQAGNAMVAQANQMPQQILALLK